MIVKEIEKIEIEKIVDIICDSCGKTCKTSSIGSDFEYLTLHANWGFNSKKDLQAYDANICEKCVDDKLSFIKFNISKTY